MYLMGKYRNWREKRRKQKVEIDFPVSTPFLSLGVLMAIFVGLLVIRVNPELLPDMDELVSSRDTIQSRTTGDFKLASDLYTARIHGCNVLEYQEGKRSLTMILRYHVNAKYDLNLVRFSVDNGLDTPYFNQSVPDDSTVATKQDDAFITTKPILPAQQTSKSAITITLPSEDIEVVQEKYAGITGNLQDGELPGIEIFDYVGEFRADEDDNIADAFLNLFLLNGRPQNAALFADEEANPYSVYLKNLKVLHNENFISNVGLAVEAVLGKLVRTSRTSVMLSLTQYYHALGYRDVAVVDCTGNLVVE